MNSAQKTSVGIFPAEYAIVTATKLNSWAKRMVNLEELFRNKPTVLLKPNFVTVEKDPYIKVTHPQLIEVVVKFVNRYRVKKIIIAEGSGNIDTKLAFKAYGIYEMQKRLAKQGIKIVVTDLNHDAYRTVKGFVIAKSVLDADVIINLPKLKSHSVTCISGAIKSFVGTCVGGVYGYPKWAGLGKHIPLDHGDIYDPLHNHQLPKTVVGIAKAVTSHQPRILNIVDAIDTQAGDFNYPIHPGVIIMGTDLVATDVIGAKLMGYNPESIPMINQAAEQGLGEKNLANIKVKGKSLVKARQITPTPYRWMFRLYDDLSLAQFMWVNAKYFAYMPRYLTDNSLKILADLRQSLNLITRGKINPRLIILESLNPASRKKKKFKPGKLKPLKTADYQKLFQDPMLNNLDSLHITAGRHQLDPNLNQGISSALINCPELSEIGITLGTTSLQDAVRIVKQLLHQLEQRKLDRITVNVGVWMRPKSKYVKKRDYLQLIKLIEELKSLQVQHGNLRVEMHHLLIPDELDDMKELIHLSQILATPQQFVPPVNSEIFDDYLTGNPQRLNLNRKQLKHWQQLIGKLIELNLGGLARATLLNWHYEDVVRIIKRQQVKNKNLASLAWFYLDTYGNVFPSPGSDPEQKLGNIQKRDLTHIWEGPTANQIREELNNGQIKLAISNHGLGINARTNLLKFGQYIVKIIFWERLFRKPNPYFPLR